MSAPPVPPWLADLQRGFGAVLRAPLDRSSGALRAVPAGYDAATVERIGGDAPARLAVYNRQYWFRLFNVLQGEMPLVTALAGAWTFNELAGRFLLDHPPRGVDLASAADGFDGFLEAHAPPEGIVPDGLSSRLPRAALVQAASVDQAFRRALSAPEEASFRPSPADAARLGRCRLVPSRALSVVDEGWPLLELRRDLSHAGPPKMGPASRASALPAPHAGGPRSWALFRARGPAPGPPGAASAKERGGAGEAIAGSPRAVPLHPLQAALLRHLRAHPVGAALALLEAESAGVDTAALASRVRQWLAEGMDLGFWTGLEEAGGAP